MMNLFINRDGQQFGPYPLDIVRIYLKTGALLPTDLAWYEGATNWVALSSMPEISSRAAQVETQKLRTSPRRMSQRDIQTQKIEVPKLFKAPRFAGGKQNGAKS